MNGGGFPELGRFLPRRLMVREEVQRPPTVLIQSETRCTTTPSIPNDALLIYFTDATLASAFVARSCIGAKVKTDGGARMSRSRKSGRDCTGRRAGSRAKIR